MQPELPNLDNKKGLAMHLKIKRIRELFRYAITLTKEQGIGGMLRRGAGFFRRRFFAKKARHLPHKSILAAQRAETAAPDSLSKTWATISVLTPLYNTDRAMLRAFFDSLCTQTAPNWQLCLADASDAQHAYVGELAQEYCQKDARFAYVKIENEGISQNTNAAAALATGSYLALADHDDILAPHAIYALSKAIAAAQKKGECASFLYSDEALFTKKITRPLVGHFKPDYAPDYLLCCNYICHLAVFEKALFDTIGGLRKECDGSQDHDLFLRLLEHTKTAIHIPEVLYYWRVHAASTSGGVGAKPYVALAAKKALADHLTRTQRKGEVLDGLFPSTYRVKWAIDGSPKVSILIPNKDHITDLALCLDSIYNRNTWANFEVIVIENNSTDPATFAYYEQAQQTFANLQIVHYEGAFNFSAINNLGRKAATGDYLLLLNNDVEVQEGDEEWLEEMLRQCAHEGGAALCGAKLLYPDGTVQHGGIVTGLGGYAGHSHKYAKNGGSGYMFRAATVQNFSGATAACLLVRADVYDALDGLDEGFTVAFNDVDFCLRARDAGHRIVWTPYTCLTHYESKSRGIDEKDRVKEARFHTEQERLYARHTREGILNDPYYNPSLTKDREDFSESNDLRNLATCSYLNF